MTDTAPTDEVAARTPTAETAAAGCPVDHEALARARQAREAGCPVDHEALLAAEGGPRRKPAAAVCAYAGGGKRGYLLPGVIALAALLLIGAAVNAFAFTHGSPTGLDSSAVATQIADSYQATHRLGAPPAVRCPTVPATAGHFTCSLVRPDGGSVSVPVTEAADGHIGFQVGS